MMRKLEYGARRPGESYVYVFPDRALAAEYVATRADLDADVRPGLVARPVGDWVPA